MALFVPSAARAQGDDSGGPPPPPVTPPTKDVGDVWHQLRHKLPTGDAPPDDEESREHFFVLAPSIGSKPSTGVNGGFSSSFAFFSGDPRTTRISVLSTGLKFSQKKQTLSGVKFSIFTPDDRWFLQGDNRLWWTSQDTYALGTDSLQPGSANVKYDFFRLYEMAYRKVKPGLFVGLGVNVDVHANARAAVGAESAFDESAYLAYSERHGFTENTQTSSGTSVGLLHDTRDNAINAQRGWLASATYRTFVNGFLGGDSTWQELYLDARTYRKLTPDARHKLAFWFLGDLVTGGTAPYLDLPENGGDGRSARGYGEGRFRGERMLYGEMEYRGTITSNGLLGMVAFLNVTTVDNAETGEKLFNSAAPAAGFGLRVLLNKRSRTNLCTDYAWGKDGSRGFYLAIQEAF
ncbi:MAG TPA: BamA/TamA family outer membrane protein [Vicinamibacterales bacterium]|nr:BamA/TamA family outer membrane protein [Vicinamibacterales bacterium]